jgi:hypothetical protein
MVDHFTELISYQSMLSSYLGSEIVLEKIKSDSAPCVGLMTPGDVTDANRDRSAERLIILMSKMSLARLEQIEAPQSSSPAHYSRQRSMRRVTLGRGILLWLLGVPIPIIILIALLYHYEVLIRTTPARSLPSARA